MIVYSKVTSVPAEEPLTRTEVKTYLKEDETANDSYIDGLISTSRRLCEAYTGLSFVTQTRQIKLDRFPVADRSRGNEILIPYGPLISVTSFTYLNADNVSTALVEDTDFKVDTHQEIARLFAISDNSVTSWPTTRDLPNAVTITYTAGYGAASAVPQDAKEAMYKQIASMYENKQDEVLTGTATGTATQLNWSSMRILDRIKVTWNAALY